MSMVLCRLGGRDREQEMIRLSPSKMTFRFHRSLPWNEVKGENHVPICAKNAQQNPLPCATNEA